MVIIKDVHSCSVEADLTGQGPPTDGRFLGGRDGQTRLLDQIHHGQQCLSVAAEKLRQSPCVCLSDLGNRVIVSLQGGSPFLSKVSNPTLPRAGSRTAPQLQLWMGHPLCESP